MRRLLIALGVVLVIVGAFAVLWRASLLVPVMSGGSQSGAPTIPACNGRYLAEGFTYRFRDPERGELVVIHARGRLGEPVTPDPDARDLNLTKRVIGVPGDRVVGRQGRVFVNGRKADDIPTDPFAAVRLGDDEFFVLGENRGFSQDSRQFGPVPRNTIFGRVVLIYWPLDRFGVPGYDKHRAARRKALLSGVLG
jgi:signal peptidase I